MRMLTTIVSTGVCAGLLALSSFPAWGQEPIDTSQTRTMTLVWKKELGGGASATSYLPSFGGRQGFDVLTTGITRGRGNQTWATRPKLDTSNLFNWLGINNAVHVRPLDYDGIPPLEYVNGLGVVWRCASTEQPLPLVPIDTITHPTCAGTPQVSADVDGDGFLDVITDIGGDNKTCRIIMGGPQSGKGCARVFPIDKFGSRNGRRTDAFFRSTTGKWRVVQHERNDDDLSSWMVIYDMEIFRQDGRVQFRAVKRDSLHGPCTSLDDDPLGFSASVADTLAKKDWLIMYHRLSPTGPMVLERFDITDGKFISVEQVTGYPFGPINSNFGYSLGTDRPVIFAGLFCYADNIRQPFARWRVIGSGLQGLAGMTAINDQTGDGKPDIVMTGGPVDNGVVALYTLDPAVSVDDEAVPPTVTSPARMMGDVLELSLVQPASVSAHIVGIEGREAVLLAPQQYPAGTSRIDLAPLLRTYPRGAYYLRVRMGDALHTINLIR